MFLTHGTEGFGDECMHYTERKERIENSASCTDFLNRTSTLIISRVV